MEKYIKKWLVIFIITLMPCVALTSCGDDTNDEDEVTSVIGTWRGDYEDGYVIYDFKKNGSYTRFDEDFGYGSWSEYGTYVVRADKYITTTTDEGDIETMTILLLNHTTMRLCWEKDDILTFIRQK